MSWIFEFWLYLFVISRERIMGYDKLKVVGVVVRWCLLCSWKGLWLGIMVYCFFCEIIVYVICIFKFVGVEMNECMRC